VPADGHVGGEPGAGSAAGCLATLFGAVQPAREATELEAIEQAIEEGKITQEQADRLLEGLAASYLNRGLARPPAQPLGSTEGLCMRNAEIPTIGERSLNKVFTV
jgi:hypothetical protein